MAGKSARDFPPKQLSDLSPYSSRQHHHHHRPMTTNLNSLNDVIDRSNNSTAKYTEVYDYSCQKAGRNNARCFIDGVSQTAMRP